MARLLAVGIVRFLVVNLLACVLLIAVALLIAASIAWFQHGEWTRPPFFAIGTMCSLITLVFVALFHLHRETKTMPFTQREQFVAKVKTVLEEMGYALTADRGDVLAFQPWFHSFLLGGGIYVTLADQEAKLIGPKLFLEIFLRRYSAC